MIEVLDDAGPPAKLLTKDEARRIAATLSLPPPIRAIAAPPTVPV